MDFMRYVPRIDMVIIPKELSGQLHSQESGECNWIFSFNLLIKTYKFMAVTDHTIKKGDKM